MKRSALVIVLGCLTGAWAQASPSDVAQEVSRLLSSTGGSTGTIEGLPASYRIETSGRFHDHATTLLNIKFASPTLRVIVRPRSADDDDVARRGQLVDVEVGDPEFDRQFLCRRDARHAAASRRLAARNTAQRCRSPPGVGALAVPAQ
jgi:hypothetical protein